MDNTIDKFFIKNNKGMTMVEVIMGFTILMLIMGMLSGIISFSKNMYFEAVDFQRNQDAIETVLYKKDLSSQAATRELTSGNGFRITPAEGMPNAGHNLNMDKMNVYRVSGKDLLNDDEMDINMYVIQYEE